ncbi:MAG TPA: hypothetical protein DCY07_06240 [Rhodospirillaceae bacterium]|nr:hypothetical protein [Rhodospirillaceae bacterium]
MNDAKKEEGSCCKPSAGSPSGGGCGCCCGSADPKVRNAMRLIMLAVVVAVFGFLAWQGGVFAPSAPVSMQEEGSRLDKANAPAFASETREFVRKDGRLFPLTLQVAVTGEQQAYGLMFRENLAENEGMIFTYKNPTPVQFWMKNTVIPLDMFFIGEDGKIVKIVKGAKPNDLTPVPSDVPVKNVVELKAGEADRMGIQVGDRLQ